MNESTRGGGCGRQCDWPLPRSQSPRTFEFDSKGGKWGHKLGMGMGMGIGGGLYDEVPTLETNPTQTLIRAKRQPRNNSMRFLVTGVYTPLFCWLVTRCLAYFQLPRNLLGFRGGKLEIVICDPQAKQTLYSRKTGSHFMSTFSSVSRVSDILLSVPRSSNAPQIECRGNPVFSTRHTEYECKL